jgi:hypothetical protein
MMEAPLSPYLACITADLQMTDSLLRVSNRFLTNHYSLLTDISVYPDSLHTISNGFRLGMLSLVSLELY